MGEISPNCAVPGRDQFERLVQHLGDLPQRCRPVPTLLLGQLLGRGDHRDAFGEGGLD
jgi:hypothetical protein